MMDIDSKFAMIRDNLGQKYVHHDIYIEQQAKIKQLEEVIEEVQQTQDMLYDEHYDLKAWRENHIVTNTIFDKALEE